MLFSVIILNYKTSRLTAQCLRSLFSNCARRDYEVIVVDNNSQDNSLEKLQGEFGDKITLVDNRENGKS